MSILDDKPLRRSGNEQRVPVARRRGRFERRAPLFAVVAIALVVLAGFVASRWLARSGGPDTLRAPGVDQPLEPATTAPPATELPPRDQMDPFIRDLLGGLSSRPELARWLTTDDLTGHISSAIDQIARGLSPARDMKVLAPTAPFSTSSRDGRLYIAPESYRRYDGLAAAAESVDADAAAHAYLTLKPRLGEAYRLLGRAEGDLDAAVTAAIMTVLETPIVDGPIEVVPGRGNLYAYADPRLESLRPAQKQLLRMGPDNARIIQQKTREIAVALGIKTDVPPQQG